MKRKETHGDKPKKRRGRPGDRKYNFVTTWDPIFPDIGKTIRKFSPLLAENKECCQLFPKGSFRMAYKRGHKNLKEIVEPSRILIQDNQLGRNSRVGQCRKCNKGGENPKGRKRANGLNNCKVLEEGSVFYSKNTGDGIPLDKI